MFHLPRTTPPTGKEAMRLSLFVDALSEFQSDSKVRPHSSASISFAQTVLFNSFSFASSASNRAANCRLILPLTLIGSTGMEGSCLELTIHSPAAISSVSPGRKKPGTSIGWPWRKGATW